MRGSSETGCAGAHLLVFWVASVCYMSIGRELVSAFKYVSCSSANNFRLLPEWCVTLLSPWCRNDATFPRLADPLGYVAKEDIFHAVKAIVATQVVTLPT